MKNLLSAFTVERLTALIEDEDARVTEREQELLAEIALNALNAKPSDHKKRLVNLIEGRTHNWTYGEGEGVASKGDAFAVEVVPLYEHPAPDAAPIYQLADDGKWYDVEKRIYDENLQAGYQGRIVYTGPATDLARVIPDEKAIRAEAGGYAPTYSQREQQLFVDGAEWLRHAVLRNIDLLKRINEGAK